MTDQAQDDRTVELWYYKGQRTNGDRLVEAWQDPSGRELWYGKPKKGYVIGGEYEVRVKREDTQVTRYGNPVWTGARADPDVYPVTDWELYDRAAKLKVTFARRHADATKQTELNAALIPLIKIARGCRNQTDRDALVATVIGALNRQAW
jgi:hypothetical protein